MYLENIAYIHECIEFTVNDNNGGSFFILIKKDRLKNNNSVGYISIKEVEILQNKCEINKLINRIIKSSSKNYITEFKINKLIEKNNLCKYQYQIISILVNLDIYNDENYVSYYVNYYINIKRYSICMTLDMLLKKRIDEDLIRLELDLISFEQDSINKQLLIDEIISIKSISKIKMKKKIVNILSSKGYRVDEFDLDILDSICEKEQVNEE